MAVVVMSAVASSVAGRLVVDCLASVDCAWAVEAIWGSPACDAVVEGCAAVVASLISYVLAGGIAVSAA